MENKKRGFKIMGKEITKKDLILNELKHINETQNEIKENQKRIEDSVDKRFDNLKTNDLAHIEQALKDMAKVFNVKFDDQDTELKGMTKLFNTKFDNQDKELNKLDKDNISINKSLEWNNRLTIATFIMILTICFGAAVTYLFHLSI